MNISEINNIFQNGTLLEIHGTYLRAKREVIEKRDRLIQKARDGLYTTKGTGGTRVFDWDINSLTYGRSVFVPNKKLIRAPNPDKVESIIKAANRRLSQIEEALVFANYRYNENESKLERIY